MKPPSGVRGFQFLLAKRLRVVQQRTVRHYLNHPPEQLSVLLIGRSSRISGRSCTPTDSPRDSASDSVYPG